MRTGLAALTTAGVPQRHATAIQSVADRTGHLLLFRCPGAQCRTLLDEGYAAKGFRIDTKSCDWGPMQGFVCVDPRLSKVAHQAAKVAQNLHYTEEALRGHARADAIGGLTPEHFGPDGVLLEWKAGCRPIVISAARYGELRERGLVGRTERSGIVKGVSTSQGGAVTLPWALIPADRCAQTPGFLALTGALPPGGYGLFVDFNHQPRFRQQYVADAAPVRVLGYEAILGLCNPGDQEYGYRACVTADYDLFAVWPQSNEVGLFRGKQGLDVRVVDRARAEMPGNRLAHHNQHYRLGNITRRLETMKVWLNTALVGAGAHGNMVHHSDEVGNPSPGLRKTLTESMPLLCFLPNGWSGPGEDHRLVENTLEFKDLVQEAQERNIVPELRPEWGNFAHVHRV